jgi:AbrB family looped-hinge helix DNA binding protein
MSTIRKITSKGQVTLPAPWRNQFDVENVMIHQKDNGVLEITPYAIDEEWESIFDAARDNNGKGIPVDDFLATLEESLL